MSEQYSRPATIEDLKLLVRSLNERKIDYLLIGGYALYAHGYARATVDIDLLLRADAETGKQLKAALLLLPDRAAEQLNPAWFSEGETIRLADAFVVDLMFNAGGNSYDDLKAYREVIDLDGIPVSTVNLEGLLLTKKTVRDKDKADRIVIEKALKKKGA